MIKAFWRDFPQLNHHFGLTPSEGTFIYTEGSIKMVPTCPITLRQMCRQKYPRPMEQMGYIHPWTTQITNPQSSNPANLSWQWESPSYLREYRHVLQGGPPTSYKWSYGAPISRVITPVTHL